MALSASSGPTGRLPERNRRARGRVRGDRTKPASDSHPSDQNSGTDTNGNNNSQGEESNFKIYNRVVT